MTNHAVNYLSSIITKKLKTKIQRKNDKKFIYLIMYRVS